MQSQALSGHVFKSIAILSLVAALAASGSANAQSGTVVKISPATSQVSVGETVTVNVVVENVSKLAAVEMRLAYNPTVLEVASITEGSFFTPVAGTLVKRDAVGMIRYEAEASTPASGSGTLVSIVFKGRAAGTANLTFSTVFLGNETGGSISATSQGGQVDVDDTSAATATPTTAVPTSTPTPTTAPTTASPTPTPTPTTPASPTPTPTSDASSAAFVKLSPASAQVDVGAVLAVEVQVENANNLAVVELRLAYNSTMLEMVSLTEGAFFSPKPGTLVKDSTSNVIRYEAEASSPASGSGTLVSIVFKGLAPGAANLAFTSLFLGNPQGGSISATSQGGQISVISVEASPTPTFTPAPPTPTFTPAPPTPTFTPAPPTPTFTPVSPTPATTIPPAPSHTPKPAMPTPEPTLPTPPSPTPPQSPTSAPPTPQPAPTLTVQDIGMHTVQRGETLYCLGRAYLVNPLAIAARNGLGAASFIYPGQRLIIPGEQWTSIPAGRICFRQFAPPDTLSTPQPGVTPVPVPTLPASTQCPLRYTIRNGDTLWSIARRYGKSPWALATYNHILNPDLIFVGDVLCIP